MLAYIAHVYFFELGALNAIRGFSVLEYVAQAQFPANFVANYPGGAGFTNASILTAVYIPLQQITGLSALALQYIMIGLEILCFVAGCLYLLMTVLRCLDVDRVYHAWGMAWLVILMTLSYVIKPDLANFSFPYFHGQFYGFGDAARLCAIAFALQRRWALVALALCLGFTIHPIKTVMAIIFIGVAALVDWRRSLSWGAVFWGGITSAFILFWAYVWLGVGTSDFLSMTVDNFTAYSRIFQAHWYPMDMGYFGHAYHDALSPFIGLMGVAILAFYHIRLPYDWQIRWLAGMAALLLVTVLGLWISEAHVSISLIQICLIRASTLMTLLAPFIIVAAILVHIQKQAWHWVAFYVVFLMAGFENVKFLSPFMFIAGALFYMVETRRRPIAMIALCVGVFVWMSVLYIRYFDETSPAFILAYRLVGVAAAYGAFMLVAKMPAWARLHMGVTKTRLVGISCILCLCAGLWSYGARYQKPDFIAQANAYKDAQLWAKDNTAQDALFMVDPCIYYGWRDYSHRSSIGTPREWYLTAWLYIPDQTRFEKGLAVGRALGLDLTDYLPEKDQRPSIDGFDVCEMADTLYYDPSRGGITRVADEFAVDYFVMRQDRVKETKDWPDRPVAYDNDYYRVYRSEDITQ